MDLENINWILEYTKANFPWIDADDIDSLKDISQLDEYKEYEQARKEHRNYQLTRQNYFQSFLVNPKWTITASTTTTTTTG